MARFEAPAALRLALALLLVACDGGVADPDAGAPGSDAGCALALSVPGETAVAAGCPASLTLSGARVLELWVEVGELEVDGGGPAPHLGPLVLGAGAHLARASAATTVHVRDHGPAPGDIAIARSLTWTDAALLDDPATLGWDRLMRAVTGGAHPGPLVDGFFRRFGTTAHSERLGPQRILEDQIEAQGGDPAAWDLDAFPFTTTGVHNRVDLATAEHCGELRVSFASTHPLHQPFHLILLFRQVATPEDRRPDGTAHCAATALRWARLSALDDAAFREAARALLDEHLAQERFLVLETVEFIISPWEWRQWFLVDGALENRPLFQTVDTERLNRPGADRDAFLAWVEANADTLDRRAIEIPEAFRSPSARVNDGVPWIPLDLGGVGAAYPRLRQQIEIVGCPACHATDADFVQTLPDRSFSPFYTRELDARAAHLRALAEGRAASPPFGPLQMDPALPP